MRITNQLLKKVKDACKAVGEDEFKYWKKFVYREQARHVYGPDVWRPLSGWETQRDNRVPQQWYHNQYPAYSNMNISAQMVRKKMPIVQPIKQWEIFLGDRVELQVGPDKGKIGEVFRIVKERNWVFVEGLHIKYETERSDYDPASIGNINNTEEPLLVPHEVKLIDPADLRATDVVWRYTEDGARVRVSARTGRVIPFPKLHLNTWEDGTNAIEEFGGEQDTDMNEVKKVTFQPKLCTFEQDICESMKIDYTPRKKKGYWY
ncbi:probable 39S ribosomal protein L24, mitochondrial isoform X3 [Dreissena polymorpha]|uniref:probable 39S ribosomal protein L24, mitochondrial isoform X3 n=1 Tax=Dreissena polymorpha TaxID=45954 RepID=UPI0022648693|nr:probable 39S ribosomal protein L24, mitochondrial isoform X3 [Dreissena polymorpha]XP_052280578.1 probable 39S ribosomal protein L24, mitochondrial isoform X3 [Dreissena polymorpha]XP_052280579.1 probable 39S ribosomal protein L24, mitochondrial isoform X3 [Dreissena polymorpha]